MADVEIDECYLDLYNKRKRLAMMDRSPIK